MTLNQLSYFTEIVRQRSFTKAADVLFVSQSALSKSIRTLEKEFETVLIDRSAKEFRLTSEGEIFNDFATRLLDYYDQETQELYSRLHGGSGELSLGLPPSSGSIYFFDQIFKFQQQYPVVNLEITEVTSKKVTDLVADGKLDLGIVIEPFADDRFAKKEVYTSEAVLVVSKDSPLASRRSIGSAQLQNERFVTVSPDYMYYDRMMDYFTQAGISPEIAFRSFQWDLLLEMVAAGQGVSILPKPLIDKCYHNRVRQIHLKDPEFPWGLTLIRRKDKFVTEPMRNFIELCSQD